MMLPPCLASNPPVTTSASAPPSSARRSLLILAASWPLPCQNAPLVLFPETNEAPTLTRQQLLAAKRADGKSWEVSTRNGPLTKLPFADISDQPYTAYLNIG